MAYSLRSGLNRLCSFSFPFRTDMFTYLFGGKGRECPHRLGAFYDMHGFDAFYFPPAWFSCCDRLGDGCTIDSPICMYSKVRWYPVVYGKYADGVVQAKKRNFEEICYVSVKTVCV